MTTRIKELPSAAGDIERQLNGASFAVTGGLAQLRSGSSGVIRVLS